MSYTNKEHQGVISGLPVIGDITRDTLCEAVGERAGEPNKESDWLLVACKRSERGVKARESFHDERPYSDKNNDMSAFAEANNKLGNAACA